MLDGIKYIFQIPMEWFIRVERFITGFYSGTGIELRRDYNGQTCVGLDKDQAVRLLGVPSRDQGTPVDYRDVTDGEGETDTFTWTAGGENGIQIDVYYKMELATQRRWAAHATLTFSKDGVLLKAEGKSDTKRLNRS